ncbi:asparagine synthase-related protein [Pseudoxanthomonas wuyuanensis]
MNYRYIILVGDESHGDQARAFAVANAILRAAGMECRFASASIRLFVSSDTPTLLVPGRGLIIGQIFTKDGQPITNPKCFERTTDEISSYVLSNSWGEYLALCPSNEDRRSFTLLRDPSGGISCVYSFNNGAGFITSDVSLAIDLGLYRRQVDWHTIAHGLNFPYLRTERTALQGVNELLPGCMLRYRKTDVSVTTAWSPWQFVAQDIRHTDPHAAAHDVRTAISTVVKAMAAVDDRFLVQLSGGLDSSIVAACLRETSEGATFCSLVMPVAGTDERPYAKLVTDSLGCELVPVHIGLENVSFDFPTPPSSVVPAIGVLQHATNTAWEVAGSKYGANSLFSGSGGDTVFCYLKTAAPAADAFRERGLAVGIAAIRNLSVLHQCTVWKAGRLSLKKLRQQPRTTWKADGTLLNPARLPMAQEPHPWMDAPPDALPGDREKIYDLIGTQLYRHARPPGATRPMRFPLLSQPAVEACLKVPTWMWIADGQNRAVARSAFAERLPSGILNRRSKGSYTGYLAAIYARNKMEIRQILEEGQLCAHDILDRTALAKFLASDLAPRDLSFLRTFDLCTVENWLRAQAQAPS